MLTDQFGRHVMHEKLQTLLKDIVEDLEMRAGRLLPISGHYPVAGIRADCSIACDDSCILQRAKKYLHDHADLTLK